MGTPHRKGSVMRLIIGNICFAGLIVAWYAAFGADRAAVVAGTVIVFITFVLGTSIGYALSTPREASLPRAGSSASAGVDTSVFDRIQ
jgi:hypothetical protein